MKEKALKKPALILLVLSLTFSVLFTTIGIVLKSGARESEPNDGYDGDYSYSDYDRAYMGSNNFRRKSGDSKIYFRFMPTKYGEYTFSIDGAYLYSIEDVNGNRVMFDSNSSGAYDYRYSTYLGYNTYYFVLVPSYGGQDASVYIEMN